MKTQDEHRKWLEEKLGELKIEQRDLTNLTIVVENIVRDQYLKVLGRNFRPFYRIRERTGNPTRTWLHVAELALWLKYKNYEPKEWITFLCSRPKARYLMHQPGQLSMASIVPLTRISRETITKLDEEFLRWKIKH